MTAQLTPNWWKALADEANADSRFTAAARHFRGRVRIDYDPGTTDLDISGGRIVDVADGPSPRGADIIFRAPREQWDRIIAGESDFMKATTPGLGNLEMLGDAVLAMDNIRVIHLLFKAMSRVGTPPLAGPAPSPDPRPSGEPTVGRYITVDGIRTYYEEAGHGPAIVCFHAACQDSLMYRYVLDGLSDQYRIIALDAPGHVKTDMPAEGPFRSLTRHAEFNEAFMAALGLEKPAIIGCSMGGNLVLELASRKPQAYAAVVSSCGADYTPTMSGFLLEMLLSNGQQIVETFCESLTGARTPANRAREAVWQIRRNVPEVMAGDLIGYAGFDKRDEVGRIQAPVLLLRGEADWLVYQEQVAATQSRIPGSQLVVLEGTGHYPMIENPYEFNETVRTFLQKNGHK
ncbi:alpha/beta fold hydrolase [Micromonospora sp. NPDC092111]|uniref:alpha/beta fold hydrolase n=1 Tax=Micromonospora sp. NPDC092111 TaxID=3364289 RepID=UPI003816BC7F